MLSSQSLARRKLSEIISFSLFLFHNSFRVSGSISVYGSNERNLSAGIIFPEPERTTKGHSWLLTRACEKLCTQTVQNL